MSLYENWLKQAYNENGECNNIVWDQYIPLETKVYVNMLEGKITKYEGTLSELAAGFDMPTEWMCGFLDGISDANLHEADIKNLAEDDHVVIEVDYENLYKAMVKYKADYLYTLPQWDAIFTDEKRKALYKEQKLSTTYVREEKIGRNDPCTCGSGKKYKKCCGANE